MAIHRRRVLRLAAGTLALPSLSRLAFAQAYPSRQITIVVPFPPGGPTDLLGRMAGERIRAAFGQTVLIENVVGANGSIGCGRVARSAPDGHTLVVGLWNTHVSNAAVYSLPYDVQKDFAPIALFSTLPSMIVARKSVPADDLKSFVAWLKANSDKATEGHVGIGSIGHVGGLLFQKLTGTTFQQVPYRGSAPVMQALVAGQIDFGIESAVTSLPQVRAGAIKAFAVAGKSRYASAPDIPTADESGVPDFYVTAWFGLYAPGGTPRAIVDKLNGVLVELLADPAARQKLADLGMDIPPREQQTPEALGAFQKDDCDKWWPIIKAAGVKVE